VEIVSIKRFARTFTVKHVFEAWGIGAAFVMTEGVFSMFLPLPALWWFPPDVVANFLGWTSGPIPGLLFYSIVLGAVAFWLLDWLYWRPRARSRWSQSCKLPICPSGVIVDCSNWLKTAQNAMPRISPV